MSVLAPCDSSVHVGMEAASNPGTSAEVGIENRSQVLLLPMNELHQQRKTLCSDKPDLDVTLPALHAGSLSHCWHNHTHVLCTINLPTYPALLFHATQTAAHFLCSVHTANQPSNAKSMPISHPALMLLQ